MLLEVMGGMRDDAYIFRAMGQGILNHLPIYSDMFETKPPGIFYLWAASLLISKQNWPMAALSIICQLSMLAILWKWVRSQLRLYHQLSATSQLACAIFSVMLMFFAAKLATPGQVEIYALLPAILALYFGFGPHANTHWKSMVPAGICLGISIFIREPLVLSVIGSGMVLSSNSRTFWHRITAMLVIASITFIGSLLVTGTLYSYFNIYLPFIFVSEISWTGPAWLRWLNVGPLGLKMLQHSPGFLVAMLLTIAAQAWRASPAPHLRKQWLPLLASILCGNALVWLAPKVDPVIMRIVEVAVACCLATVGYLCVKAYFSRDAEAWRLAATGGGILSAAAAVSIGGDYFEHHYALAVPVYFVLFISAIPVLVTATTSRAKRLPVLFIGAVIACVLPVQARWAAYQNNVLNYQLPELQRSYEVADILDTVLDRCGFDRYQYIGADTSSPMGVSRHSPLGPAIFQMYFQFYIKHTPFFLGSLREHITKTADVVLVEKIYQHHKDANFDLDLQRYFTTVPPACAGDVPSVAPYTLLFRKP